MHARVLHGVAASQTKNVCGLLCGLLCAPCAAAEKLGEGFRVVINDGPLGCKQGAGGDIYVWAGGGLWVLLPRGRART